MPEKEREKRRSKERKKEGSKRERERERESFCLFNSQSKGNGFGNGFRYFSWKILFKSILLSA